MPLSVEPLLCTVQHLNLACWRAKRLLLNTTVHINGNVTSTKESSPQDQRWAVTQLGR